MVPPWETQNSSTEPSLQQDSCTMAAQCPWVLVRLGMAMQGRGRALATGDTLVKPTRRAPCQLNKFFSTLRRIFSWILTGRLLNTRPFLKVLSVLSASRHPWLSLTMVPTAWRWKARGPRQDSLHLCDLLNPTAARQQKHDSGSWCSKHVYIQWILFQSNHVDYLHNMWHRQSKHQARKFCIYYLNVE